MVLVPPKISDHYKTIYSPFELGQLWTILSKIGSWVKFNNFEICSLSVLLLCKPQINRNFISRNILETYVVHLSYKTIRTN